MKSRVGVVRLRGSKYLTGAETNEELVFASQKLYINSTKTFNLFRVALDLYALEMAEEDYLCLDYSNDSGATWETAACVDGFDDFETNVWYSPDVDFPAQLRQETLMIRLRNTGDVLLNKVDVLGWKVFGLPS